MRSALSSMLSSDPDVMVLGTARDGVEAVEKVLALKPDVVTMDIEMPKMDGLSALRVIMERCPVPVVMVSSLTAEGAKVTIEALEIGALDFIPKNLSELSINVVKLKEVLIEKVKQIAKKGLGRRAASAEPPGGRQGLCLRWSPRKGGDRRIAIVAIGTSTGGPKALQEIVPKLPRDFPVPIVIAQHMPPNFTGPFAERLNHLSPLEVREAREGDLLRSGLALVAPGRGHMRIRRQRGIETAVSISEKGDDFIYRPSVDAMMLSVAECFPGRALGVILTGMGSDGAKGLAVLKRTGGRVIAQDEDSCVVYGMPKAVVEAGLADEVVSIENIAGQIMNAV
jgi:two-component system chemotaxis response regulator CheB